MFTSDLFTRTPEATFKQRAVKPIRQRPLKYIILSGTEIDRTMSGALIRNLVVLQLRSKRSTCTACVSHAYRYTRSPWRVSAIEQESELLGHLNG